MFAYVNYRDLRLCNGTSIVLLIVLSFLAYLVSPQNSMRRTEQDGLLLVYPAIVAVYWFIFLAKRLCLDPVVHYGGTGVFVWATNSIICLVFGAAFSIGILRSPIPGRRFYGACYLALYVLLSIGFKLFVYPPMAR
jgi:hypothetical protein